jgi:hypothetical protein
MSKVALISLANETVDISAILAEAFLLEGSKLDVVRLPWEWNFKHRLISKIKRITAEFKREGKFVVLFPNTTEIFLRDVDFSILFSAYRRWFDDSRMHVIPHVWFPAGAVDDIEHFTWKEKPPLRIGFMGTNNLTSRMIRFTSSLPTPIKQIILSGHYLRAPSLKAIISNSVLSLQHTCAFARADALNALKKVVPPLELDLVERMNFGGLSSEVAAYREHMRSSTYVFCPRGTENYSFRLYEALSFGRIPVIIDSEMVFPSGLLEAGVALRVPYDNLERCYDIIKSDYEAKSPTAFIERQQNAVRLMAKLKTMEWSRDLSRRLIQLSRP